MTPQEAKEAAIKLKDKFLLIEDCPKHDSIMCRHLAKECAIIAQKRTLWVLQNIDNGLRLSEKLESETGMLIHESIEREKAILKALEEL